MAEATSRASLGATKQQSKLSTLITPFSPMNDDYQLEHVVTPELGRGRREVLSQERLPQNDQRMLKTEATMHDLRSAGTIGLGQTQASKAARSSSHYNTYNHTSRGDTSRVSRPSGRAIPQAGAGNGVSRTVSHASFDKQQSERMFRMDVLEGEISRKMDEVRKMESRLMH